MEMVFLLGISLLGTHPNLPRSSRTAGFCSIGSLSHHLAPAPPLVVVLADAGAPAVLALAPDAVMLADAGAPAVLALAPLAVVLADVGTPAVLAFAPVGAALVVVCLDVVPLPPRFRADGGGLSFGWMSCWMQGCMSCRGRTALRLRSSAVAGGRACRRAHVVSPPSVPACCGRSRTAEAGSGPHCGAVFGGEEEGSGVRSGPGAARTILLFHILSARPSKQPLMVRAFLKVYAAPIFVSARTSKRKHYHGRLC